VRTAAPKPTLHPGRQQRWSRTACWSGCCTQGGAQPLLAACRPAATCRRRGRGTSPVANSSTTSKLLQHHLDLSHRTLKGGLHPPLNTTRPCPGPKIQQPGPRARGPGPNPNKQPATHDCLHRRPCWLRGSVSIDTPHNHPVGGAGGRVNTMRRAACHGCDHGSNVNGGSMGAPTRRLIREPTAVRTRD
jgi:hypothetical protein